MNDTLAVSQMRVISLDAICIKKLKSKPMLFSLKHVEEEVHGFVYKTKKCPVTHNQMVQPLRYFIPIGLRYILKFDGKEIKVTRETNLATRDS